ncbi:hypothetical protein C922_05564 [Plasmodium inui San Antonio 1]|uniref:Uncharacterized protein n=1 Tax=Plasmodium inui San Antonio 1 TaxID=1237626 RepID=W6ZT34_9APIC|nr:hypothetical protein C922_05564 [Plasmodium inui San Antonio 1]EUD64057.1 hypothetical protein C922_05564 [Plasmodium inui San Antonio 1]
MSIRRFRGKEIIKVMQEKAIFKDIRSIKSNYVAKVKGNRSKIYSAVSVTGNNERVKIILNPHNEDCFTSGT